MYDQLMDIKNGGLWGSMGVMGGMWGLWEVCGGYGRYVGVMGGMWGWEVMGGGGHGGLWGETQSPPEIKIEINFSMFSI